MTLSNYFLGPPLYTDPQGKACLFNDYFKSVFKQVDKREQDQLPDIPIICEDHLSSMWLNDFDVFNILSKLDVNKACGPDNVSQYVLKMCAHQITCFFQYQQEAITSSKYVEVYICHQFIKKAIGTKCMNNYRISAHKRACTWKWKSLVLGMF